MLDWSKILKFQNRILLKTALVPLLFDTLCSGVARGAGARGQGILTVPPEKSVTFFPPSQKNWFLSLKISDNLLLVIAQYFYQSLQHMRPFFTQLTNETPHFAP